MKSLSDLGDWKPSGEDLDASSIHMIVSRIDESVSAGLLPPDVGESGKKTIRLAFSALAATIEGERVSRTARDFIALTVSSIVLVTYAIAARDPEAYRAIRTADLGKRLQSARIRKAEKKIPSAIVQQIILAHFNDRQLTKGTKRTALRAERVLGAVNASLASEAERRGVKPVQYKDADSLRRRFEAIGKRTTQ